MDKEGFVSSAERLSTPGTCHNYKPGLAVELAHRLRIPDTGRLDINATTSSLGLEVRDRKLPRTLWGFVIDDQAIIVNRELRPSDRRFAIAHEIGHILVRRGIVELDSSSAEEHFSDRFAFELLLPTSDIDSANMIRAQLRGKYLVSDYVIDAQTKK